MSKPKRNPNAVMEAYEDQILDSMARCLWLNAWVSWVEEIEPDDIDQPGQGESWNDYAPSTPKAAKDAARDLVKLFVAGEKLTTVEYPMLDLYEKAILADTGKQVELDDLLGRGRPEALPEEFGFGIASMAISNGTSWFDDHKTFAITKPFFECHYDGEDLVWSGGTAPAPREEAAPEGTRFLVMIVDGDARDAYAVRYTGDTDRAIEEAMDIALPDEGSSLEYAIVSARDAGAARLMAPRTRFRSVPNRGPSRSGEPRQNPSAAARARRAQAVLAARTAARFKGGCDDPKCPGWVTDRSAGIQACDMCNSEAKRKGLPEITDHDASQLPEAQRAFRERIGRSPPGARNPFIGYDADKKAIYGPDVRVKPSDAARLEPLRGYSQVLAAFDSDGKSIGWVLVEDLGFANAAEWMKATGKA